MKEDFRTVPESGAPISIKKVVEHQEKTGENKTLTLLIDGSGTGFAADDPSLFDVSIAARIQQAEYFIGLNLPLPNYLRKYLEMMFPDDNIDAKYKFASTSPEVMQVIGLVQLLAGGLNMARKQGQYMRFYIEEPEARLHPSRQAQVMNVILELQKEYGFDPAKVEASLKKEGSKIKKDLGI
jgi:hypothetical protein